eukprot:9372953-Alexandrium_andersonii.AAC.1
MALLVARPLPRLLVHEVLALLSARVGHLPEDVEHRDMEVFDDPRRHAVVLVDGVVVDQVKVGLDALVDRWAILDLEGEPPDVREVGLHEDVELVLHDEDAVHSVLDHRNPLLKFADSTLQIGRVAASVAQERRRVEEHAEGRE